MKNNLRTIVNVVLLVFISIATRAQPSNSTIDDLRSAIVRVESGNKIGTGFLWKNTDWIVTTLHLIDNHTNIEVTLANDVKNATVIKVLKEYDLVLLKLSSPASQLRVISNVNASPQLNSDLYTMGYNGNGNLNAIIDRTLRLGYNSSGKLEGLLPKAVKNALNSCKRPSPFIEILYLDGTLLPGFSGSPIIDNSGKLVGIADGGLESGASSISWGIKANKLTSLLSSNETFPQLLNCGGAKNVSFSSENLLEEKQVDFIEYREFKFIKTKVRTVQEMMHTIDDPLGLQQLINAYSMSNNTNYLEFEFDIYEDLYSGMTFCVPRGTVLELSNDLITGSFGGGEFKLVIYPDQIQTLNPNPSLRYVSSANSFQQKILAIDGGDFSYQKDFNLSYSNGPIIRYDGIKVNREAYRGYAYEMNSYGLWDNVPKTYTFQTHIGRKNYYLGVSAINMSSTLEDANNLNFCINNGQCHSPQRSTTCENICNEYQLFSQLVIGVHMGGFSNNYDRNNN